MSNQDDMRAATPFDSTAGTPFDSTPVQKVTGQSATGSLQGTEPVEIAPDDPLNKQISGFTIRELVCLDDKDKAEKLVEALIKAEVVKATYGFHEYIISKNIIRAEADQAFNYARLHRTLDDYIAELEGKSKEPRE